MGQDKERKPIPKWVHFCFWSGVTLFAFYVLFLICNQLWILSHKQNWSGEVNAAIINTFISAITLAVTIGVTVYFNLKTQKITIDQNQKNLELQMELHKQNLEMQERINKQNMELQQKMQEMNYKAMMHQSRSTMRDYVYQLKIKAYREIIEKYANLRRGLIMLKIQDEGNRFEVDEELFLQIKNLRHDLYKSVDHYQFLCSKAVRELFHDFQIIFPAFKPENPPKMKYVRLGLDILNAMEELMYRELSIELIEEDIAKMNKDYVETSEFILRKMKEEVDKEELYYGKEETEG